MTKESPRVVTISYPISMKILKIMSQTQICLALTLRRLKENLRAQKKSSRINSQISQLLRISRANWSKMNQTWRKMLQVQNQRKLGLLQLTSTNQSHPKFQPRFRISTKFKKVGISLQTQIRRKVSLSQVPSSRSQDNRRSRIRL